MLYRLDSEYHNSQYIFIDWERMDACLKPSDRDKAGRLCGKRATSGKQAGKIKAGSKEAKALAQSIREQSYGAGRKGKSPQRKAAIAAKAADTRWKKKNAERIKNRTPEEKKAAELRSLSVKRSQSQAKQLAENPAALKSLQRKINRNEGRAGRDIYSSRRHLLKEAQEYKETGKTGLEKLKDQYEEATKRKSLRK